jgi:hypothetical protein
LKFKEAFVKKVLLLFTVSLLLPIASVLSQTLSDYVKQVKGDTLVIKDYSDMKNQPNSLYWALTLDTVNVPAGRVYELQAGGVYPLANIPTSRPNRTTVIVGSDSRMVVTEKDALSSPPPLICGAPTPGVPRSNPGGIGANGDLTIKNCALVPAANDGTMGWAFTATGTHSLHLLFDNDLFEHTLWIFVSTHYANCDVTFSNCYFVNMSGHAFRRHGGVFDCFANQDTLLVENCTHIMAQGFIYRVRDYPFKRIIINHNTFINCADPVFQNFGYQSNMSLTNNMFINCNIQSYPGNPSIFPDRTEQDPDLLPMGLVNVYPDSADVANNTPRRFLCQDNLVYWDPSLANMDSTLDANRVDGWTNWRTQMIIMNSRSDSVFKHIGRFSATPYSYCVTDTWKNQMPHFTDPEDLFTTQLANIKTFDLAVVDTGTAGLVWLPDWRLVNTSPEKYVYPDWPIPVNLSYSDADLKTAGLGGFPLGDLNWFPDKKAVWSYRRDQEYAAIQSALDNGSFVSAVHGHANLPGQFELEQNYPNPFNPTTVISYQLPISSFVTIKVYDVLGREVQTLVNEGQNVGNHSVTFSASNLSSGVYFYRLLAESFGQAGNYSAAKKLLLLK